MNCPTTILIFPMMLSVLAVVACPAEHPMDRAAQTLSAGDTDRAVEMYRQAIRVEPSAEGYNNLGVALERSRRFEEAKAAYTSAMHLADDGGQNVIDANRKRARLRAWLQSTLPYAARAFGGLVVACLLVWLAGRSVRTWRDWRFRMKLRGVCAVSLTHRAQCHDGQFQPDGKVYPDSESLSIKADLTVPCHRDIYPLDMELEILRPDGVVWETLRETVATPRADRVTLWFQIDRVGELFGHSGTWNARLVLHNTGECLANDEFAVVDHAALVSDLEATSVMILAVRDHQTVQENVIFPDVEALVPTAVIRPRSFHPSKFAGLQLRLDLVDVDNRAEVEGQEFPLELSNGAMEFCSVSRPIADDELAEKLGRWEFRLSVEGRELARMPFVITSVQQALESLKIESFEVVGVPHRGSPSPVGTIAYVRNVRSLCPVVRVTSQLPSRRVEFQTTMGVCVDGEPIAGIEGTLVMDQGVVELMPGEFSLPRLPDGHNRMQVSFVLLAEARTLGIREVTLRSTPPRCADVQGRIMVSPTDAEIDYGSEAARILHDAHVG